MKLSSLLPAFAGSPSPVASEWHATEPWVRFGNRTVMFMCGGLLVASLLFSISGAVVASGAVSVEGDYKAVQHLEGGIVSKILVHNGDRVKSGQVLVELDSTQARASMIATSSKVVEYTIQEARLIAERDRKPDFDAPTSVDSNDADASKIIDAQKQLFTARRTAYLGQKKVLNEKLSQTESDLMGAVSQLTARTKERDLNQRELDTVRPLFEQGYVNQQRIGPLEREAARIAGDIGNLKAEISKMKSARSEVDARISQADKDYTQQAAEELQKVQALLAEQTETKKSISDKLARTEIRAPVDGTVHALSVHTEGGVIQPGGTLGQIVPEGREMIVEAKLVPRDINSVFQGQSATIRFTAFDSHTTPRIQGVVRTVSAAEITDNQGKSYFTVEVQVPPSEIAKLEPGQRLLPGMPAEVFLETHSRSILSYFLKPLGDMMSRTFREH